MLFAFIATGGNLAVKVRRVAYATAVFLVLALPEVAFLYKSTGKVLLEAKSRVLFSYTGRRILAAETKPGVDYVSDGGRHEVPSPEPNADGGILNDGKRSGRPMASIPN
jgi:hypothetical protein